jgi:hypothetical protein
MMASMKLALPDVPEVFWQRLREKIDTDELVNLVVPVYSKYFSHEEINALIAFYSTRLGEKITTTMPAVVQECMVIGQQWGVRLAQQVEADLREEGYR